MGPTRTTDKTVLLSLLVGSVGSANAFVTTTTVATSRYPKIPSTPTLLLHTNQFVDRQTKILPFCQGDTSQNQRQQHNVILFSMKGPGDQRITFGSERLTTGENLDNNVQTAGEEDEEVEEDENGMYERERKQHQAKVAQLLQESDQEWKEERRRMKLGEYADAKTKEDIRRVEESIRAKIAKENEFKQQIAKLQGVELEILEAPEADLDGDDDDDDDVGMVTDLGNVRIKAGSSFGSSGGISSKNWYNALDKDLEQEWEAMESGNERLANARDGSRRSSFMENTVRRNGKVVSRDTLHGVRVGSAGGWTLEIFPGDFVVHRKYGIGRFERTCLRPKKKLTPQEQEAQMQRRGELLEEELRKLPSGGGVTQAQMQAIRSKFGTEEDSDPISNPQTTVLEITYSDGVVHVPVDRAYRLSRYRAGDAVIKPRLSKVRGDTWSKTRRRVEENTLELAQDVLALYATRETLQRQPFDPEKEDLVKAFGDTFLFEPTPDQKKCFEDVENDMVYRSRPMDRLVCGDVGFGKTEVAMRAIFRAVANGKQAALLAPTGVLASQHFKNVVKRMGEGSPFNRKVALLRGGLAKTSKAGKELREDIALGKYDVIVGTHALLSSDMKYHDLGLLVVDEEQRFGVKQKERLKLVCGGVDVLTLSATPIPRTLQMSLSGIRDTSTIRSPPPMRKPTITYVQDYNKDIVQMAIQNELDRGGQCYYVVPKISMLKEAADMLISCFPELRVVMAHGRMPRTAAEDNVAEFAEGKYDVLLATTVIENGVDIPTVNTIIIQDSQNFGMATLYQLRGRVGRSDLQGYAYLLHREEIITEQAALRLQAIGELHELGSGFDVANRDLEIRGAGSLLGTEQSGMAARIGFDLYMRMLKKSIRRLRGLDLPLVPRTNILFPKQEGRLDVTKKDKEGILKTVSAIEIPPSYISDELVRRKEEASARLAESTANLVELTNQWKETYGPIPASLQNKLKTLHLHACTRRLGIDLIGLVDNGDGRMDCIMRSPGLRPRHWGLIVPQLKRGVPPQGLDVVFPARFTLSGDEEEVVGGKSIDLKALLEDPSLGDNDDADNWDALDKEEIEAMKDISSAYSVKHMDEVDIEMYPRFVIKGMDTSSSASRVDQLLKVLLPVAKVVAETQEAEKASAKQAAELRERQKLLQKRAALNEAQEAKKYLLD